MAINQYHYQDNQLQFSKELDKKEGFKPLFLFILMHEL